MSTTSPHRGTRPQPPGPHCIREAAWHWGQSEGKADPWLYLTLLFIRLDLSSVSTSLLKLCLALLIIVVSLCLLYTLQRTSSILGKAQSPAQNENKGHPVWKYLITSRWWQQGIKPHSGPFQGWDLVWPHRSPTPEACPGLLLSPSLGLGHMLSAARMPRTVLIMLATFLRPLPHLFLGVFTVLVV